MPHRRRLRSASTEQLDVPTCRRSTIGGRAFPVAGAKVWNGLTSEVTSASSLSMFKNRLKTYLFRRCYETVWLSITFPSPSHYLPPQNSGPCNSFYCLGHSKNVHDDDDDDDDSRWNEHVCYATQKLASGPRYTGWSDVTESTATIRSPFCGYNVA